MRHFLISFFLCLSIAGASRTAQAEPLDTVQSQLREMQQSMQQLSLMVQSQNQLIQQQAAKIATLERVQGISRETITGTSAPPSAAVPASAPAVQGRANLIPDIGVVGTVQANMTETDQEGEGRDTIALKELELNLSQYVDPYSRLDAIIAFNDNLEEQNVDIEEAYYSHWGLPLGFRGQIGKFRSKIGKQNLQHLHALDTVDYAEVIKDFFGEEGLSSSGARLSHDIPNPWDLPIEITGEVLRGNNGNSFSGISRRPIFNTHAKTFFETSENSDLELGWTTLFGDENPPQFSSLAEDGSAVTAPAADGRSQYGVKIYGADATFNWYLPEGRKVKFQNEVYFQKRGTLAHVNDDPWGFYSLLDYRFSRRFSAGLRFDYVEPLDIEGQHVRTTAVSPYFTFWQSEFADFRLQYTHKDPADSDGISDDAVFLAANFLIGDHKHPVQ